MMRIWFISILLVGIAAAAPGMLLCNNTKFLIRYLIEYEIFGEGSHISTNQRRESTVFSLLIG